MSFQQTYQRVKSDEDSELRIFVKYSVVTAQDADIE